MLAPLLVASLVICVLVMLAGWAQDQITAASDQRDHCPLFSPTVRSPRGA
jgi:hypothetical protein